MDEAAEQQSQVAEIDKLISTSITDADEAELEAELNLLIETSESGANLPDIPINLDIDLPSVPTESKETADPTPAQTDRGPEMVAA